jgi:aminomethyltransferase
MENEIEAVRTNAGIFNVSHFGEIEVAGNDAPGVLEQVFGNGVVNLATGTAKSVDGAVVYRLKKDHFLIMVGQGGVASTYNRIMEKANAVADAVAFDASSRYAVIAVAGPKAQSVVQPLTGVDLGTLQPFDFAHGEFANVRGTVSRTGLMGTDGFEILVPPQQSDRVWQSLVGNGAVACDAQAVSSSALLS